MGKTLLFHVETPDCSQFLKNAIGGLSGIQLVETTSKHEFLVNMDQGHNNPDLVVMSCDPDFDKGLDLLRNAQDIGYEGPLLYFTADNRPNLQEIFDAFPEGYEVVHPTGGVEDCKKAVSAYLR